MKTQQQILAERFAQALKQFQQHMDFGLYNGFSWPSASGGTLIQENFTYKTPEEAEFRPIEEILK